VGEKAASVSDAQGLAFAPVAGDYERGRAGWPPEVLNGVGAESVLDLGAGTGKLTELLVERYPEVVAVEPLESMRAILRRKLPQARVLAGSAERIPLDDSSVDAVFVAEAFHWFDSRAAAFEIARVLRPNGKLVVAFNEWLSPFEPPIGEAARAAIDSRAAALPPAGAARVATGAWKDGIEAGPFGPLDERAYEHSAEADRESVAAYYVSISSLAQLDPEERERLRRELIALLPDATFRLRLAARVFTTVRA
jgi:ubiquinone/menaquinone biosynthesis C-methylase UbiE